MPNSLSIALLHIFLLQICQGFIINYLLAKMMAETTFNILEEYSISPIFISILLTEFIKLMNYFNLICSLAYTKTDYFYCGLFFFFLVA